MIIEIRLWADGVDCRPRKVVINDEAISRAVGSRLWTVGDLVDLALATAPADLATAYPDRRQSFRVIEGGKSRLPR